MVVQDLIFCISNEQREHIYDSLRGLDHVRSLMSRSGDEWQPHAVSLKAFTDQIAEVLNALPRDPRCSSSAVDPDATVPCPRCAQSAGPPHRITAEGESRTFFVRCQSCGHQWSFLG